DSDVSPTEIKDKLLPYLDEQITEALTAEKMETACAAEFVGATLALLTGACQCVAELEGVSDLAPDDSEEDDEDVETPDEVLAMIESTSDRESDEDEDGDEAIFNQLIDSLGQVAVMAAAAGQTLIERPDR